MRKMNPPSHPLLVLLPGDPHRGSLQGLMEVTVVPMEVALAPMEMTLAPMEMALVPVEMALAPQARPKAKTGISCALQPRLLQQ